MQRLLVFVAITAFASGYATGAFAKSMFDEPIRVIGDWFVFRYAENPGIAFGLRIPSPWQEILILTALGLVAFIAVRSTTALSRIAYGLILGGALANVVDRIGDGHVSDFIAVGSFPVFNVPDSCITVGVALLLAESLELTRFVRRKS